jgi:hypothetical protein
MNISKKYIKISITITTKKTVRIWNKKVGISLSRKIRVCTKTKQLSHIDREKSPVIIEASCLDYLMHRPELELYHWRDIGWDKIKTA